ncbi:MAG TPA: ion transporter [Tepidisphaeraceae bacterium]|nr:ion transporter [Tepidisphaeraceae bacterium]
MSANSSRRERLYQWVDSPRVQWVISTLILLNAITLGLETSRALAARFEMRLHLLERSFLTIFAIEIALKLLARGPRFFADAWNVFDFVVVGVSLVPATGTLSVLRALRVLRILRLLKTIPRLRMIVEGTLRVLPDLGWVFMLLILVFYVFAVIGTKLFGQTHPIFFGSLGKTMFTLFQIMTLESWSMGVARVVMETHGWAWVYFVSFILTASFIVLNMVIGVVVNGFQGVMQGQPHAPGTVPQPEHQPPMDIERQIAALHAKLDRLLDTHAR